MNTTKIFVIYDAGECDTVGAAETMNEAITLAIRYMNIQDYLCKLFSYDESYTVIDYENTYRVGPDIHTVKNVITIMETTLFKSDE